MMLASVFMLGAMASQPAPWFETADELLRSELGMWRGVAFNDLDGDGDADLAASRDGGVVIFRNDGGRFVEAVRLSGESFGGEGIALIDADADGRPDLIAANRNGPPRHYRNQGSFRFTLVTDDLAAITGLSHAACVADFDGDGWLDLAVITREDADDILLRNDRGRFRLTHALRGSRGDGRTCAVGDWNGDRRTDLYVGDFLDNSVTPQRRALDKLYLGVGPFTFEAAAQGHVVNLPSMTYGATSLDWDEDGLLDLAVAHDGRADRSVLYHNRSVAGALDLYPRGDELGLTVIQRGPSKGQVLADFDNDGDVDVFYAEGTEGLTAADAPFDVRDELYERQDKRFVRRSDPAVDPDLRLGAGAAAADFDRDGDLDLLSANWGGESGQALQLYRNRASGRSISLALRGRGPNTQAIGAKVVLTVDDSGQRKLRYAYLLPQTGYASMNEPVLHFGLGSATRPISVDIHWPDGLRSKHELPETGQVVIQQP